MFKAIKKIVIYSQDEDNGQKLKAYLYPYFQAVQCYKARADLIEAVNNRDYDTVFIDGNLDAAELFLVFKALSFHDQDKRFYTFLLTEDSNVLRTLVQASKLQNIKFIETTMEQHTYIFEQLKNFDLVWSVMKGNADKVSPSPPTPQLSINPAVLKSLVKATKDVMETMVFAENLKSDRPFIWQDSHCPAPKRANTIKSYLSIHTNFFKGRFLLCFPFETYLKVLNSVMLEEYTEISDETKDFICELLNMIYGQAKVVLNEAGFELPPLIPVQMWGKDFAPIPGKTIFVIPFSCNYGNFYVEVEI